MWLQSGGTMLGVITGWISAVPHKVCEILLSLTVHSPQSLIRSVLATGGGGGETSFHSNCILSGNDSWLLCCPVCKQRNLRRLMVVAVLGGGNSRLSRGLSRFYSNRSLPQASQIKIPSWAKVRTDRNKARAWVFRRPFVCSAGVYVIQIQLKV